MPKATSRKIGVTPISPLLHRWFVGYAKNYLKKHFNAVRLLKPAPAGLETGRPLVFYFNHPSWWDPLAALFLAKTLMPAFSPYGPIDAAALERYPILKRLGFFPVDESAKGVRAFLRSSRNILARPRHAIWITPQGRFADVRERPLKFKPGLAHLGASEPFPALIPVAIEYTWWFERLPEVLIAVGAPAQPDRCEDALAALQDELARAGMSRDVAAFETLLSGRHGIGGTYDLWRRVKARWRGETFDPHHHP